MFKWKTNVNVANTKYNVANTNYNAANKNYNVANVNYNVANTNYNAANTNYNVANVNYNVANTNYNVANVNYNVANVNYNVANTNYNVANMKLEFWRKYDTIKIKQFNSQVLMQTTPKKFHYKATERHFQNTHKRHDKSTRSLYRGVGNFVFVKQTVYKYARI